MNDDVDNVNYDSEDDVNDGVDGDTEWGVWLPRLAVISGGEYA